MILFIATKIFARAAFKAYCPGASRVRLSPTGDSWLATRRDGIVVELIIDISAKEYQ